MCQPITLSTSGVAEFLAVDAVNVYWGQSGSGLMLCPIGGGCGAGTLIFTPYSNPTLGESDFLFGIANTFGPNIFAMTSDSGIGAHVAQINKTTHASSNFTTNTIGDNVGGAFDNINQWVFFLDNGDGAHDGALWRMQPNGTQQSVVLGGLGTLQPGSNPAVDGANVYVADYGVSANQAVNVYYCPLTGSCSTSNVVFTGIMNPGGVASNGTTVFATERGNAANNGAVYSCPVNTHCGKPTPIASGQAGPMSIVADIHSVYWVAGTHILSCPVTGCGAGPVVVATSSGFGQIAQDAHAIYYGTGSGIFKLAK
jgi:hypothetical protein